MSGVGKVAQKVAQRLYWIRLPLVEGQAPAMVLALAVGDNVESTRLVLSDLDNQVSARRIVGAVIPEEYQPSFEDRLQAYFKQHGELYELVIAEGGAAHGPLTTARAIHFAAELKASPEEALAMAKQQSELCRDYCARLLAAARPEGQD